jgi:hypothetical protein
VICGDRRLTYAELEERVNRLAHHLADGSITLLGRGSTCVSENGQPSRPHFSP